MKLNYRKAVPLICPDQGPGFGIVKAVIIAETGSSRYNMAFVKTHRQDASTSRAPSGKPGLAVKVSHTQTHALPPTHIHSDTSQSSAQRRKPYNVDGNFQSWGFLRLTTQSPTLTNTCLHTTSFNCMPWYTDMPWYTEILTHLLDWQKVLYVLFTWTTGDKVNSEWANIVWEEREKLGNGNIVENLRNGQQLYFYLFNLPLFFIVYFLVWSVSNTLKEKSKKDNFLTLTTWKHF